VAVCGEQVGGSKDQQGRRELAHPVQADTDKEAPERSRERVAREFRCTTFFGRFGLGEDGRQQDHQMLAVQWQDGVKRIEAPPSLAEAELRLG
jgi:hypothetical protein